jgi:restriction system protein
MSSRDFAQALEVAFRAQGHEVRRSNAAGADLELTLGHKRSVVGFKRWKAASVGVEALRELHAAQLRLEADASLYVAAGAVSDKARDFAREARVQLVGPTELAQLVRAPAGHRRP